MKLTVITRFKGWMKTHWTHFGKAFSNNGNEITFINYEDLEKNFISLFCNKDKKNELRNSKLEKIIKSNKPDALLFIVSDAIFDLNRIKTYYKGTIAVYDMDGPAWSCYNNLSWIKSADFLITASKFSQRQLNEKKIKSFYWADGVDTEFYNKKELTSNEKQKYNSNISFIGRPTPRRNEYLSEITDFGLKLWGRRWRDKNKNPIEKLQDCNQYDKDIFEEEIVKVYNSSDLYINILREPLNSPPTILSLQTFAVPSCSTCLIQEWVEELDEAFEDGKEVLSFKTKEEFVELVKKYSKDKSAAKNIGEAGRKRVLAQHTHVHRAKELLNIIKTHSY